MSFEERNAAWDGKTRRGFVQPHSRSSTPRAWMVWVEGKVAHTMWGQIGGQFQHTTETFLGVNIGKSNELSPEAYALDRTKEMCRKKNWEGYREVELLGLMKELMFGSAPFDYLDPIVKKDIDFDDLPLSLSFYKPDNTMGAGMMKKAVAGKVIYTRKRNGLAFILARGKEHPRLYSRRMLRQNDNETGTSLTWNDRFPHLIEAATEFMPENSILLGELVMDRNGIDDFAAIQSYVKSLTLQSLQDQRIGGFPSFYIWDMAFWGGEDVVSTVPTTERIGRIHEIEGGPFFLPIDAFACSVSWCSTPENAVEYAKSMKLEGWVVVDPDGIYGDKAYNFKGKPDRPGAFCSKLKPEYEDDFIAMWDPECRISDLPIQPVIYPSAKRANVGERSTKDRSAQGIKSVALFQINSAGHYVYISNVSSGLTDAMKKDWASREKFPQVWQITFTERAYVSKGDDTNALTFARFDSVRMDKSPEECVNQLL